MTQTLIQKMFSGVQRIHDPRHESAEGTESHEANHAQGNREDGADYSQKVLQHSDAAEAVHVRGCHDLEESILGRQVRILLSKHRGA